MHVADAVFCTSHGRPPPARQAPEQLIGLKCTAKADVYSFGLGACTAHARPAVRASACLKRSPWLSHMACHAATPVAPSPSAAPLVLAALVHSDAAPPTGLSNMQAQHTDSGSSLSPPCPFPTLLPTRPSAGPPLQPPTPCAVLWELCTRELPVRGQIRDVRCPQEAPPAVAALIRECLDVDPARRPDMEDIIHRLIVSPGAAGLSWEAGVPRGRLPWTCCGPASRWPLRPCVAA